MDKAKKEDNVITMTKRKFYLFLGFTVGLTIVIYGIVEQAMERIF
ncbi:hypothetical protein ACFFGV_00360 [Pontibacillus salicampi]|uniref:Uncharacterized protein n=1 Tax=Pontibacillus salicampi TaxID=1449801 RepID=A0ABV6LI20_9BACI